MKQNDKQTNCHNPITRLLLVLLLVGGVAASGWGQSEIDENFQNFPSNVSYSDFTHEGWGLTKVISSPTAGESGTGSSGLIQFRETQNSIIITPDVNSVGVITINARASTTAGVDLVIEKFVDGSYSSAGSITILLETAGEYSLIVNDPGATKLRLIPVGSSVIYLYDFVVSEAHSAIPPIITNIIQVPETDIASNDAVEVSADVTAGDATIDNVALHWNATNDFDAYTTINMSLTAGDSFTTDSDIPVQTDGTIVYYRIYAEDTDNESSTSQVQSYRVTDPPDLPYSEYFSGFVSMETLPVGWEFDDEYSYEGAFGSGSAGGLRGDGVLGFQLISSSPNNNLNATLTLQNNTGATITDLSIKYTGKVERADQEAKPKWVLSVNGTDYPELEYSTADGVDRDVFYVIRDLSIEDEELIVINWFTTSDGTSGVRRQIGVTDVEISAAVQYVNTTNPANIPADATISVSGDVTLTEFLEVKNLFIQSNSSLTISPTGTLTVNGVLNNENSGTKNGTGLFIQSDAFGTGSIIHNTPGVLATAERYIVQTSGWGPEHTAIDWHFISSPVANQSIDGVWTPDGVDNDYDFFAWEEGIATWLNQKAPGNEIDNFTPGAGYLVAYQQTDSKEFSGELNTGEVSFALLYDSESVKDDWTYQPGWNLLGNPYPSAFDWNAVDHNEETSLFVDNFAFVYDRTLGEGAGGYEPIDGTNPGAVIPANQGFFVRVKSTSHVEDFTFTNAMRLHGGDFYKNQALAGDLLILRLTNEYYDETTIRILEGSGFERDRTDALKLFSFADYAPQLYSFTSNDVMVAVNSIPHIDEEQSIILGMRIPEDGEYSLSLQEMSGPFTSNILLLEDTHAGVIRDLHTNPVYAFEATEGMVSGRFLIHFGKQDDDTTDLPDTQLPVVQIWHYNKTLYVDNPGSEINLYLYDIAGRRLQHFEAPGGQQRFELNLPAGVYVIKSSGKNQYKTIKIIIQ